MRRTLANTIVAWDNNSDRIALFEAPMDHDPPYECTDGAAYAFYRKISPAERKQFCMHLAFRLVSIHGVKPEAVLEAFSELEEFKAVSKLVERRYVH